ncbi:MAG TPA: dTDP-4-dehydrorhamnose 3,5-epimerase family protein [Gaiellaceae bacterium]|nr:dTDP-4-dehydrorhamnose 3,5-epimerase family protein [Gaiellaceae bacterium]
MRDQFADHGLTTAAVQANVSFNPRQGTLRGMHFQSAPAVRIPMGHGATVEAYDLRTDTWRAADPLPVGRHGIQAVVCGGAIYVAAGGRTEGGENPSSLVDVYLPRGGTRLRKAERGALRSSLSFTELEASSSYNPTTVQFGPDGRLYVAQQDALIKVYSVVRRVDGRYGVTATEKITAVQRIPNHDDDGSSISDFSSMVSVEQKLENAGLL